jgi:hypothetical protein
MFYDNMPQSDISLIMRILLILNANNLTKRIGRNNRHSDGGREREARRAKGWRERQENADKEMVR